MAQIANPSPQIADPSPQVGNLWAQIGNLWAQTAHPRARAAASILNAKDAKGRREGTKAAKVEDAEQNENCGYKSRVAGVLGAAP